MKKLSFILIIFFVSNSLNALELKGTFYQGNFIIGKIDPNARVFIDKKQVKVSEKGFFAFGLSKDRKNDVLIEVEKSGIKEKQIKKKDLFSDIYES